MIAILVVIITGISNKDVSYDMKIKNLKQIIVDSQKELVDKKMNAGTFFELSKEYKNRGDTVQAIKYIRSAMVADPANGAYRWFLAKLPTRRLQRRMAPIREEGVPGKGNGNRDPARQRTRLPDRQNGKWNHIHWVSRSEHRDHSPGSGWENCQYRQ